MLKNPISAREMVLQIPLRYKKGVLPQWESVIHLVLKGDEGGSFTVSIKNETVTVTEGLSDEPDLVLKSDCKTYQGIELGTTNPKTAFFLGKISVSNLSEMGNLAQAFYRVYEMS